MDRLLIDYLPESSAKISEMAAIMRAEQAEIESAWSGSEQYLENAFIQSEDRKTASRWEKMLKLTSKDTDELDVRNLRILAAIQEKIPYTHRTLRKSLIALLKNEKDFSLVVDSDRYLVDIVVALSSKELKDEVEALAERVIPLNMRLVVRLRYTTHRMLERKIHGELEAYTHDQLIELELG